ncbi:MAG TPA: hypothetical protein VGN72_19745 [Tepidisphaeraceae bacterium]|jgi:hypothetical protein|nr:hypothetical protein [Tepidisphaeraceae bacterium]
MTKFKGSLSIALATSDTVEVNDLVDNAGKISYKHNVTFDDAKVSKMTVPTTLGAGLKVEFLAEDAVARVLEFAAAGTDNFDLVGALTDPQGSAVTPIKLKAIIIENRSPGNNVLVGGHASAAFSEFFGDTTDKVKVGKNGGVFVMSFPDGLTITPTTDDILLFTGAGDDTSTSCKVAVVLVVEV